MNILTTKPFDRDYARLPERVKRIAEKQLLFLLQNSRHPSLQTKKMKGKWGTQEIFEARVTQGYRFSFQIIDGTYLLRRIGPHDIERSP